MHAMNGLILTLLPLAAAPTSPYITVPMHTKYCGFDWASEEPPYAHQKSITHKRRWLSLYFLNSSRPGFLCRLKSWWLSAFIGRCWLSIIFLFGSFWQRSFTLFKVKWEVLVVYYFYFLEASHKSVKWDFSFFGSFPQR